ncbi:MAG: hypothetical protein AABY10_02450, partial [Nanoarchaeota archaeon]
SNVVESFADFTDAILRVGETFFDEQNNIKITALDVKEDYLDLCLGEIKDCLQLDPPIKEDNYKKKNRYLSFLPENKGKRFGILVKAKTLPAQFSSYIGEYRFVGPKNEFKEYSVVQNQTKGSRDSLRNKFIASKLQCEPYYANWDEADLLNIYGENILPGATYEIYTIDERCSVESCLSEPLTIETSKWGDVNNDNLVNEKDITEIINKLKRNPKALSKTQTQLGPNLPNPAQDVNSANIIYIDNASKGEQYPFEGPSVRC